MSLEVVGIDSADLGKVGLANPPAGGGLVSGEDLRFGDAQQEGERVKLERSAPLQVVIEVLGEVPQVEPLQQSQ